MKNTVSICIRWYDRNSDFSPNYDAEHHGTIHGKSAADCWLQFVAFKEYHDLAKFTIPEIILLY